MKIRNRAHFGIERKIVASKTTDSWKTIPHASLVYEPDVTDFYEEYRRMAEEEREKGAKITFNTLMLKVLTEALKEAPTMNAHIEYNAVFRRGRVDTFHDINISLPTILPNGKMMTLNMRDFGNKDLREMATYAEDIRRRAAQSDLGEAMYEVVFSDTVKNLKKGRVIDTMARLWGSKVGHSRITHKRGKAKKSYRAIPETERLTVRDLEPGSITISNSGSIFRDQRWTATLLEIIPPQVCAINVGAVQEKPVVRTDASGEKKVVPGQVLPICIAFDHRALDFGDLVPFLNKLAEIIEEPSVMRTWL